MTTSTHPRTAAELERENAIMREALDEIANRKRDGIEAFFCQFDNDRRIAFRALCRIDNPEAGR